MINDNPLKQYFRRPAVYIKLPSGGKLYDKSVIDMPENGELPVFPMTAIDEITSRTPDALYNGNAVADLIKSCIPNIKDPWAINTLDIDTILLGIKSADNGNTMDIESQCPSCTEYATYSIDLIRILSQMKPGNYVDPLKLNDLTIQFRPLKFSEVNKAGMFQLEIQKEFIMLEQIEDDKAKAEALQKGVLKITEVTMKILTEAIEYVETPGIKVDNKEYILDFLQHCDKNVYQAIRDHNSELRAATEIQPLHIKCINCQHDYEQPFTINPSDFFG